MKQDGVHLTLTLAILLRPNSARNKFVVLVDSGGTELGGIKVDATVADIAISLVDDPSNEIDDFQNIF
jgi:hypothetical protein